jgi:hypothetical protein
VKGRLLAVVGLLTLAAALVVAPPEPTTAAWTVPQQAKGTFEAGTVMPPTAFRCVKDGVLSEVTFEWTEPVGGIERTSYEWTLKTPGSSQPIAQTPLGPAEHTLTVKSGLLVLGESKVSLIAKGTGGWTSASVTGAFSAASVLGITLASGCSVP